MRVYCVVCVCLLCRVPVCVCGSCNVMCVCVFSPEAVPALAAIAASDWPAAENVSGLPACSGSKTNPNTNSKTLPKTQTHWADVLVDVHPSPDADKVVKHSARRIAVCCLAEMSNYEGYCEVIVRQCPGLLHQLPAILTSLLKVYKWRQ